MLGVPLGMGWKDSFVSLDSLGSLYKRQIAKRESKNEMIEQYKNKPDGEVDSITRGANRGPNIHPVP